MPVILGIALSWFDDSSFPITRIELGLYPRYIPSPSPVSAEPQNSVLQFAVISTRRPELQHPAHPVSLLIIHLRSRSFYITTNSYTTFYFQGCARVMPQ